MSYKELITGISKEMQDFSKTQPKVMGAFSSLAHAASQDGVLDAKTKEYVALGIAIATRCDPCIGFHIKAMVELNVTREELDEVLSTAIYMGGGPSLMYAMRARQAFDELSA